MSRARCPADMHPDYQSFPFSYGDFTKTVYARRHQDGSPCVIVMHEIPGPTPKVLRFCDMLFEDGFSVYLPHLFGEIGAPLSAWNVARELSKACVSREFAVLAAGATSPIVDLLRALARHLRDEFGQPVGALGMCLTGNFALAMAVDDAVVAPVLSQPSLPLGLGSQKAGLHISAENLARVRARCESEGLGVLGLRFERDPTCSRARFDALRAGLGKGFESIEIDNGRGNPFHIAPWAHSVLTNDLVDEAGHPTRLAYERVVSFFRERLRPSR